jgi:hypothetical protein
MKIKPFAFDETTCEILLGENGNAKIKKKKRDKINLEIIYLDKKLLIFKEDNNPKGYVTHICLKMTNTLQNE